MKILIINAGSSSLKYQLIESSSEEVLAKGLVERIGIEGSQLKHAKNDVEVAIKKYMPTHAEAINAVAQALVNSEYGVIDALTDIDAVGHRVVHGGEHFSKSVLIDDDVKKAIKDCFPLAPLHNPPNMTGITATEKTMPGIPQVAVFDTAFHQTMPDYAYIYALPYETYEKFGVRRYGFHGTSHNYVSSQAAKMMGKRIEELKIITLHLGNGSSISAIDGGKSVDTTMGLTPLAGVPMGTRCGDIDPAIVKFLMDEGDYSVQDLDRMMNNRSGMLGVSGVSSDFRDLSEAAADGNARAALALAMFKYQCRKVIGSYVAAMGGVDAIIFTAGVGENDFVVRQDICDGLSCMGIKIDNKKNENAPRGDGAEISADDSPAKIFVIPTNEELMIAKDTERIVSAMEN